MKRLIKTPKLHLGDTGLACTLLGLDGEKLWKDRAVFGRLLETFVYQKLRRHASWQEETIIFSHCAIWEQSVCRPHILSMADKLILPSFWTPSHFTYNILAHLCQIIVDLD